MYNLEEGMRGLKGSGRPSAISSSTHTPWNAIALSRSVHVPLPDFKSRP